MRDIKETHATSRHKSVQPDNVFAMAIEHHSAGRLAEAEALYLNRLQSGHEDPAALHNYGVLKAQLGQHKKAITLFDRTLSISPDHVIALNNKGNSYQELGHFEQALESYDRCLRLRPKFPEIHNNKGDLLRCIGRLDEAGGSYRLALTFHPNNYRALFNLALVSNSLGRRQESLRLFKKTLHLKSNEMSGEADPIAFSYTTKAKICHDIEQFRYLESRGKEKGRFQRLTQIYESLEKDIDWPQDDASLVPFTDDHLKRIRDSYNRPIHLIAAPEVAGSSINENLNSVEITHRYRDHAHGLTYFDELLNADALQSLRRYLLESTIWFDFKHISGHVAAYLESGLSCPLILQIAEDLRHCFPDIFKNHALTQIWAFKNVGRQQKIDIHMDDAAVSVNFWITPDRANRNPEHGGLVVYDFEAPLEWRLNKYDQDIQRLRETMAQYDPQRVIIPYRQNRAILFNSDLYHESDEAHFGTGYENHRINMTFLYGSRRGIVRGKRLEPPSKVP